MSPCSSPIVFLLFATSQLAAPSLEPAGTPNVSLAPATPSIKIAYVQASALLPGHLIILCAIRSTLRALQKIRLDNTAKGGKKKECLPVPVGLCDALLQRIEMRPEKPSCSRESDLLTLPTPSINAKTCFLGLWADCLAVDSIPSSFPTHYASSTLHRDCRRLPERSA